MTKRFNTSKKVWINYGFFLMKNGKTEAGRKLLQRSFQSLPERKRKLLYNLIRFATADALSYACGVQPRKTVLAFWNFKGFRFCQMA